jgi:hypothetical protein
MARNDGSMMSRDVCGLRRARYPVYPFASVENQSTKYCEGDEWLAIYTQKGGAR